MTWLKFFSRGVLSLFLFLTGSLLAQEIHPSRLSLNELFVQNGSVGTQLGLDTVGWVEIHHAGSSELPLDGYGLTDDPALAPFFIFPTGSRIKPNKFQVVYFHPSAGHSNQVARWIPSPERGTLYLMAPPSLGGSVVDRISYGFQVEDVSLARVPDGAGAWTAGFPTEARKNIARPLGSLTSLKINEWMSFPSDGDPWFELYNASSNVIALGGVSVSDDILFPRKGVIPENAFLGPDQFLTLSTEGAITNPRPRDVTFTLPPLEGSIHLFAPEGTHLDHVSYAASELDVSEGRLPDGSTNIVRFMSHIAGDPIPLPSSSENRRNHLYLTNIVISEVLPYTYIPKLQAIEIYNPSSEPVDIGGWYLSNSRNTLKKIRVRPRTIIPPQSYKVFNLLQFAHPKFRENFFLDSLGDQVVLSQADRKGNLSGYRAEARFQAAVLNQSFGRVVTPAGADYLPLEQTSFGNDSATNYRVFQKGSGKPNNPPIRPVVEITEILFRTAKKNDGARSVTFVELRNNSTAPVSFYDSATPTNSWRLSGSGSFTFPPLTLPAGHPLILVSFDPVLQPQLAAEFRQLYQIPDEIMILGPLLGFPTKLPLDLELYAGDTRLDSKTSPAPTPVQIRIDSFSSPPPREGGLTAAGTGQSLQKTAWFQWSNNPENWRPATPAPGR